LTELVAAFALAAVVPLLMPALTARSGGGGEGEGDRETPEIRRLA